MEISHHGGKHAKIHAEAEPTGVDGRLTNLFFQMRSEGFLFYLGALGVDLCSLDVAFVFAFATAGSTSAVGTLWGPYGVPIATAAKVVTSGGFKRRAVSFRVAGVGLCDIPTCFIAYRKSFCVTGTILLQGFQKRTVVPDLHVYFAWHAQHFRHVVLRVFCESHCQGCVRW